MTWNRLIAVTAGALLLTAAPARADFFISPTIGMGMGGLIKDGAKVTFGGQAGVIGAGPVGFEVDYGYTAEIRGGDGHDNIRTFSGILLVAPRQFGSERWRPYGAIGGGVIGTVTELSHIFAPSEEVENKAVLSAGGGILGFLSNRFGVRADARYFHAMLDSDDENFPVESHFIRISGGVVIRF
jgi:hypothetical protein